jgi:CRISPR-associated endonuclease Cas1
MAASRATGRDPAHGGAVAEKRRAALARRRASGELVGRLPRTARLDAIQTTELSPLQHVLMPEQHIEHDALAYLASGNRYEGLTAKLLTAERTRGDGRTLILAGYGAGLRVERDALIVTEGHTHDPQTPDVHTLYRGVHGVERIICLDPQGSLSFPAVRWCAEQEITIVLLDRSGNLLSTLTPEATADAALRRRQYLAQATGQDVLICQELLRRKLAAQRATLVRHPDLPGHAHALDVLATALAWLMLPELPLWLMSVDMVRTYEARTARAYFAAWDGWPLRWDKAGTKRVPPHWKTARDRSSPLSPGSNARHAVDPLNAVLNYAYALLEGQCRQALTRLGFDVVCGFLHLDKQGRDSLVYDLMECERGTVDGLVLDFFSRTTLHWGDVTPVSDGSCRLHPQLARAVVAGCRVAQDRLDEHARWLRSAVLADLPHLPTAPNSSHSQRRKAPQRHAATVAVSQHPLQPCSATL